MQEPQESKWIKNFKSNLRTHFKFNVTLKTAGGSSIRANKDMLADNSIFFKV
jgi:hypothetical protein